MKLSDYICNDLNFWGTETIPGYIDVLNQESGIIVKPNDVVIIGNWSDDVFDLLYDDEYEEMMDAISYAEGRTESYGDYCFSMAIAYGGRQEIVNAVKDVASRVKSGELDVQDIDENLLSNCMYTFEVPDPDLVLRTSGEFRLSNFLLWQLAYSELYFTDVYWPSFRYIDFLRAIRSYQQRARRFGT